MLSLLFTICMIWFVGKFFVFGLRASWGIMKLLCTVIFFPVILIGMVVGGLMYIAFPLLIVGGFFTTMLKRSRIDQAKRNMEQAKYDLRNFSRELNDVNMVCNLNIDTGDFLSFADYFFDGFVVDWVVQDRINNAKRQVEEAIRRTESIVNQLQRM